MIEHSSAQQHRYERGDRVKHRLRPEWGVGTVTKAEDVASANVTAQRIAVRFPNAGLKTLNTNMADIEVVANGTRATPMATVRPNGSTNGNGKNSIDSNGQSRSRAEIMQGTDGEEEHWLGPVAAQKRDQVLQSLPEAASDPFSSLRSRLGATLDLYRFDRSPRGLIDWAVAQTGIEDPLSTYNRHELEEKFDRWFDARADHLRSLLRDKECTQQIVRELLAQAPASAKQAVQRFSARR